MEDRLENMFKLPSLVFPKFEGRVTVGADLRRRRLLGPRNDLASGARYAAFDRGEQCFGSERLCKTFMPGKSRYVAREAAAHHQGRDSRCFCLSGDAYATSIGQLQIGQQAERIGDPVAKRPLLTIAKSYEELARRAEARGKDPKS